MDDQNILFIVSQPRSGSTLLQALISNNSCVETVSEPWLLLPFLSIFKPNLIEAKYDFNLAMLGVTEFSKKLGGEGFLKEEIRKFALNFYTKLYKKDTRYILDKTPRYYEILSELIDVFPNAKVIILKRHPFAVLNSIIDTWIKEKNIDLLKAYDRDILYAPYLLDEFSKKHINHPNVFTVKYEDIAQNPLYSINSIYSWLDIPFNEENLNYSKNNSYKGLMGDPTGVHRNEKPEKSSLTSWEKKLQDKFWSDFFKGYGHYLGEKFLEDYGTYEFIGKETMAFNEFMFKHKNRAGITKISLKAQIKYRLYKSYKLGFLLK